MFPTMQSTSKRLTVVGHSRQWSAYAYLLPACAAAVAVLGGQAASAANSNGTWLRTGATSANWTESTNWVGGVIPGDTSAITGTNADTSVATFNTAVGTYGTSASPILINSVSENIKGITFDTATGGYYIGTTAGNSLYLSSGGSIQVTNGLTSSAGSTVNLNINAPLVIEGANGTYSFVNNAAATGSVGAAKLVFGGSISGGSIGATVLTLDGTNTNANTLNGLISNGAATSLALTKEGTGSWTLAYATAANSFSGGVNVNTGTLTLGGNQNTLGTGAVTIGATGNNANLYTSGSGTFNNTITLGKSSGSGTVQIGASAGNSTFSGAVGLNSAATILANGGNVTFSNTISSNGNTLTVSTVTANTITLSGALSNGTGSSTTINSSGLGTLILANDNSALTGTVNITSGNLTVKHTNALRNSTLVTPTGGTSWLVFDKSVNPHSFTFGGLSGSGNIALKDNNATPNAVALTVGNNNADTTYSGVLSDIGSLTKVGTGTLTMSGANTYTGTTAVTVGKLLVNGSLAAGSAVSVSNANTTIGGSGTIGGSLALSSGTILAPGDGVGVLTAGSTGLANNAILNYDLGSIGSSDRLQVNTALPIGPGITLNVNEVAGFGAGTYHLINYTTLTDNSSGFTGWSVSGLSAGQNANFALGSGSVDLVVTVPEPASLSLIAGTLAIGLLSRRRQRRQEGALA